MERVRVARAERRMNYESLGARKEKAFSRRAAEKVRTEKVMGRKKHQKALKSDGPLLRR
jgi:hypothetical protein